MTLSSASRRARQDIDRISASASGAIELRTAVLERLRAAVEFDYHVWLLTDPRTTVGASPLADIPMASELPRLIRLKYATRGGRWTALIERRPPVAVLSHADERDPDGAPWREMLRAAGIGDVLSTVFADRFGCWGFLDLWRAGSVPFGEDDRELLGYVAGAVTTALRARQARTFATPREVDDRDLGPMVLLLDNELRVVEQTASTDAWLRVLVPVAADRPAIPAAAYNVGAQLLAVERRVDDHHPSTRVHLAGGRWVTLRAARISDERLAVTIEDSVPAERLDMFARSHGFTARETELLDHIAAGNDTHAIARRMLLSENTVQDHLKSVFEKTAARNRPSLLSRALGTR